MMDLKAKAVIPVSNAKTENHRLKGGGFLSV